MSTSYIPREGSAQQQLIADLQQLYDSIRNQGGLVCLVHNTFVFLAELQP